MDRQAAWKEIDRLISELKLQEAVQRLDELLPALREAGDEEAYARALIRGAQLRAGSAEPGEAVRFLQSQLWPENRRQRAVLSVFFAEALKNYYVNYRWTIWKNEAVLSDKPVDVEKWTTGQLFEAASKAYLDAWKEREVLGTVPVSELSEFVEPNNYPKEVRGTLRDMVTYLWVEHLADTGFWSPAQSNATNRFDLAALFRGGEVPEAELANPEVHPLVRIVTVLAELERWHLSRGNRDGALEARLERLRRLQNHALPDEMKALRQELEAFLPAFRDTPWWAMGMAELATLHRNTGDLPGAVRAARAGHEAFPKSPGGERSLNLAREIEAPEYYLGATRSDNLGRRSIQVQHKNLPVLWFRAYPVDLRQRIERTRERIFPMVDELLKGKPAYSWKTGLPATPDHQTHTTYVTPEIGRPGAYVVVASGREDFATLTKDGKTYLDNMVLGTPVILGDLALLARRDERNRMTVTAVSGSRGEPVAGVEARWYETSRQHRGFRQAATSNAEGMLPFDLYQGYAVLARKGDDIALLEGSSYRGERDEPKTGRDVLVFTDRSIYRPQQKLFWKVLVYDNLGGGRFGGAASSPVTVHLVDPNNQDVDSLSVTTNGFGTASGEFTIPPGRPLGVWTIRTSSSERQAQIRVEEYKRPTFEVSLEDPKDPLRLNRPARFPGEARYYFGLPVTHGEVRWRATREERMFAWWWPRAGSEETVATGTAELSADGTFEVAFTPEAGDLKGRDPRQVSYFYRIDAELTDEGGETRSAKRSFRLGWTSIEAEIIPERDLFAAGQPGTVTIQRRDLAGIGRPGEGTWTLFALRQPAETPTPADLPLPAGEREEGFLTEGDRLRPRANPGYDPMDALRRWEDGPQVASGSLKHGAAGEAGLALPALDPGAYRLRYETRDEAGEPFSTSRELIVAGSDTPLALPALLLVDDSEVRPGGRLRVLAHSGFPDQTVWLETWRGNELESRRQLRMGRDSSLIEIPIGKEDRGGFSLQLATLRDHQLIELEEHIQVPWDDRRLEIEVGTFRDRIRPGSRETWTVKVRPAEGEEATAAELLAYLYDRSLDLFAPHQPADPLALYPDFRGVADSGSSLGSSYTYGSGHGWRQELFGPYLQPDQLRFRFAFQEEMAHPMRMSAQGVVGGTAGGVPPPPPPPPPSAPRPEAADSEGPMMKDAALVSGDLPIVQPAPELRSDFSETAFWQPHLIAGEDGTVAIEFDVPDSVTSWSFWVHAVTADLRAGSLQKEVRSVKDLMVRPYVPRFLRESDRALLEVVLNNASEGDLSGTVQLDILDPESNESLLADFGLDPSKARAPFTITAGGGTSVTFPLTAPKKVGPVAFKVTATARGNAGNVSDGELRPLPILPSRMHLAQSRFAALKDQGRKELRFEDMSKSDPTRIDEQLVVTLDAQLFYSVLEALPYLVDFPYECTEQTLNRFLSTGIAAGVFDEYPAVAAMAKELSKRDTRLETWDAVDPNRKMVLEETPWLRTAQGGADPGYDLIKVLDPRVARAQRDQALGKLREAQLGDGGFPWWPGGQASPYMTLYMLYGFAKAREHGIEVPGDMVESAWRYVVQWYRAEEQERRRAAKDGKKEEDYPRELLVFMNYVASAYPGALDDLPDETIPEFLTVEERRKVLDDTFVHWKKLSGFLKVLLAMTLNRMDRQDDAKLVFDAVMDLAKTTEEEGTFFAPEKEAWLWYQDTIETHAFALLAMTEIAPDDPRRHGLVQWLFLNKQLNHWHSTRATAEVIYALIHYLEKEGQLGIRESATIRVAGQSTTFVFEPDRFTGKHNQVVVPGEKLGGISTVVVEKESAPLMFASATWHFSTDQLPTEARGDLFGVTRRYFLRSGVGKEVTLKPLEEGSVLEPGNEIEVHLTITSRAPAEYVHLRDPRAAGLEPDGARSGYKWDWTSPGRYEETRDSGTNFFFDWLPAGEYTLKYRLRANMAGTFRVGPATLQSMYAPEFTAYSAGDVMTVAPAE
ncbi:MAG TPA: MG2 domain-containing protein [Thermoanaerobaculia bacterium]|nr:MG2 domain-containing protein [Thermoanaerobaculia bacterium]